MPCHTIFPDPDSLQPPPNLHIHNTNTHVRPTTLLFIASPKTLYTVCPTEKEDEN